MIPQDISNTTISPPDPLLPVAQGAGVAVDNVTVGAVVVGVTRGCRTNKTESPHARIMQQL